MCVVVDSENSDWIAWLYPSPYTAAYKFGIVIMALDGVLMQSDTPAFNHTHSHTHTQENVLQIN